LKLTYTLKLHLQIAFLYYYLECLPSKVREGEGKIGEREEEERIRKGRRKRKNIKRRNGEWK